MLSRLKRVLFCFLSLFFFMSSSLAHASDASSGCGPGWYILKNNSLVSSFLRSITNGVLFPIATLGMTFGTSNCTKHTLVENEMQSEHLVSVTFDKLRQDIAQGRGEFLDAYAETFKCKQEAKGIFTETLKANYETIFAKDAAPEDIVENTRKVVQKEASLARHCESV